MQWTQFLLVAGSLSLASAQGASKASDGQNAMSTMSGAMGMSTGMGGKGGKGGKGMNAVPSDLSGGFMPQMITIKVNFGDKKHKGKGNKGNHTKSAGDATASAGEAPTPSAEGGMMMMKGGKKNKMHVLKPEWVKNQPKFHLGHSKNQTMMQSMQGKKWVIMMVDTTDMNNRMLHYVHGDYMAATNGSLMSTTTPQMAWMAPGSMGEDMNQKRQYTFLMYTQTGDFSAQQMPQKGQAVNVPQFAQANNLQKAVAGKSIAVSNNANNKNGTGSGSGSGSGGVQEAAAGAGSSFRSQALTASVVGAVVAVGMAIM